LNVNGRPVIGELSTPISMSPGKSPHSYAGLEAHTCSEKVRERTMGIEWDIRIDAWRTHWGMIMKVYLDRNYSINVFIIIYRREWTCEEHKCRPTWECPHRTHKQMDKIEDTRMWMSWVVPCDRSRMQWFVIPRMLWNLSPGRRRRRETGEQKTEGRIQ